MIFPASGSSYGTARHSSNSSAVYCMPKPVPAALAADPARLSAAEAAGTTPAIFLDYLKQNGIIASAFGPQTIRFVTHLDVTREMVERAVEVLRVFKF